MVFVIEKLVNLQGWRRYVLSALLGAVAALAFAPFFLLPFIFVSFTGLFLLIKASCSSRQAALTGWFFGFGHFVVGLYWIANSLLVEAEKFAWLIPFAVSGIPAVAGLYIAAVAYFTYRLRVGGWLSVVLFTALWTFFELCRANWLSGFPWNLTGYVWAFSDVMIQPAAIWGIYGLSFMTVLLATIPAVLIRSDRDLGSTKPVLTFVKSWMPIVIVLILVGSLYGWGMYRLSEAETIEDQQALATVRIIQPNIPQALKWNPETMLDSFEKHIALTRKEVEGFVPDAVIWPEAAPPFVLEKDPELRQVMADAIPKGGYLVTGAIRAEIAYGARRIYNSVQVLDSQSKIVAHYDKHTLVPFGEYVPFRRFLPFIDKITHGSMDFSRGPGPRTLETEGFPAISPLVCYEVIFPGNVVRKHTAPALLVNVTNDAWFGDSSGPYQHFHMARLRAVEEGLPLVRAANTGISGLIDPYGRVIDQLGINEEGILDVTIPPPLNLDKYDVYKPLTFIVLVVVTLVATFRRKHHDL